jgi:protein-S-isoprenylcysteine O-methyltransferase
MNLPSLSILGVIYGLSELGLALWKRSPGTSAKDRGSLRLLWTVILGSLVFAYSSAAWVSGARAAWLRERYGAGVAIFFAGLFLRWCAIFYLGQFFTVDVSIAKDHRLIDSGPYRLIRHPSYLGALLAFAGLGICLGNWLSLVMITVPITIAFLRRIAIEEEALVEALGPRYTDYARRTRRLIPFLY